MCAVPPLCRNAHVVGCTLLLMLMLLLPVLLLTHNLPLCPLPPLLQAYANSRGIGLVGDMPIYVGGQSADVWAHRDLFELQPDGTPALVRCAVYAVGAQAGVVGIAVEWGHMGVGGCGCGQPMPGLL